jgi:hypothetical protein
MGTSARSGNIWQQSGFGLRARKVTRQIGRNQRTWHGASAAAGVLVAMKPVSKRRAKGAASEAGGTAWVAGFRIGPALLALAIASAAVARQGPPVQSSGAPSTPVRLRDVDRLTADFEAFIRDAVGRRALAAAPVEAVPAAGPDPAWWIADAMSASAGGRAVSMRDLVDSAAVRRCSRAAARSGAILRRVAACAIVAGACKAARSR